MRALVTGAGGFVGRHIVKRLVDLGYNVAIVDDMSTGRPWRQWPEFLKPQGFKVSSVVEIKCDVREYMQRYEKASFFDAIFHCAAVVGGRKMIDGAPLHVATDLSIDADFFNWCCAEKAKPRKVVYFSSSAVYPTALQTRMTHVALNEGLQKIGVSRIGMPDQTYGWAKLSGEVLMRHAVESYGLDCVCYRPFSGYGEDQDFSYPFPTIVRRIAQKEDPIVVWGSGDQVRDFIHIDDVVDAVFETYDKLPAGTTLNLGTGIPTSFRDLIKTAKRVIGHTARVKAMPAEPEGVFYRVADTHLLHQFYVPKITVAEGVRRVYEYQRDAGLLTPP